MSSVKFSVGIFGGLFPSKVNETGGTEGSVSLAIRSGLQKSSKVLESERFVMIKSFRLVELSSIIDGKSRRRQRRLLDGATQGVEFDLIAYAPTFSVIKNASKTLSFAIKAGPSNADIAAMLFATALAANIPPPLSIRLTKDLDLFDRYPSPSPSPPPPISPEGWGALWGGIAGALVLFGAIGLSWRIVTIRNKKTFAAAKELEFLETNKKAFERINRLAVIQGRLKLSKEEQEALDKQDAEDEEKLKALRNGGGVKEKVVPRSSSSAASPNLSDSTDQPGGIQQQQQQQITLHFDDDEGYGNIVSSSSVNIFKDLPFGLSFGGGVSSSSSSSTTDSSFQGSNPMISPSRTKKFETMQSTRFGVQTKARGGRDSVTITGEVTKGSANVENDDFGPTKTRTKPRLSRFASSRRQMNGSSSRDLNAAGAAAEGSADDTPSNLKKSLGKATMSSRFLSLVGLGTLPRPSTFTSASEEEEEGGRGGGRGVEEEETVSGFNPMKFERKPMAAPASLVRTKSELRQARQAAMIKPKMLEKEAKIESLMETEKTTTKSNFFGQVFGMNQTSSTSSSDEVIGGVNPMLKGSKPSSSSSSSSTSEPKHKREKIEAHHYLEKEAKEQQRKEEEEREASGGSGVGVISTLVRGFYGGDKGHNKDEEDDDQFAASNPMRAPPHTRTKTSFDAVPTKQRPSRNTGMSRRNLSLLTSPSSSSSTTEAPLSTSERVKITSPHYLEKEVLSQKRKNELGVDPFATAIPNEVEEASFEASNPMKMMMKQKQQQQQQKHYDNQEEETAQRIQVQPRFLEKEARLATGAAPISSTGSSLSSTIISSSIEGETFSGLNPMAQSIQERTVSTSSSAPPPLQQQRPIISGLVGRGKKKKISTTT
jgi:hypothetical protein